MPQFEELMEALDAKYFEADVTAAIEVIIFLVKKFLALFFQKKNNFYILKNILGGKNGNRKANGTHGKIDQGTQTQAQPKVIFRA